MPYYRFTVPAGAATLERKADVAAAVTRAHCEITGAPPSYVHCAFVEVPRGSIFVAGEAVEGGHLVGSIRDGRSGETKRALLHGLADAWTATTGEPRESVAIYLHEAPGSQMLEDGAALPEADRD